jgi:FkbM family methyltransferase
MFLFNLFNTHPTTNYRKEIHQFFPDLPPSDEVPERMAVLKHMHPDSKVLEIGANKGGVSSLIASKLKNPLHLVAVEPIDSTCEGLKELGTRLNKRFNIFNGVLRGENSNYVECTGQKDSYATCKVSTAESKTQNLTLDEIEKKFQLVFDTVIIDCEGCYESFLHDVVNHYSIKQIQIEWDGTFYEEYILRHGFVLSAVYVHKSIAKGVRVYDRIYECS